MREVEHGNPSDALKGAITVNKVRIVNPRLPGTGLRTNAARHDALSGGVAEEFLVQSRLRRGDAEMGLSVARWFGEEARTLLTLLDRGQVRGSALVPLPPSAPLDMPLGTALRRRRSIRRYRDEEVPFATLATLVRAANGITGEADAGTLRASPSGGALYPVQLHVCALRIGGLARGLYVHDPHRDALWRAGGPDGAESLVDALAFPGVVIGEQQAAAVCLLVARPGRTMRKYGSRGMRYVFLEAGSMAEHLVLAGTALGLGSVHCGSFYDDEAHEALEVDGVHEALAHTVFLGVAE